ncbi:MAG TPA: type III PLP-dependent enzyme [Lapillicoccus sp.]|nr:type III PLP-dependent enzyme [Lapillicoccus sp.]
MTITEPAATLRATSHLTIAPAAVDLPTTPFLEIETAVVTDRLAALAAALPGLAIHYAVKANPHPDVLAAVVAAGANFDVASPAEVRACLAAGAAPDDLVYSNPVKRRDHIVESAALGVRVFVVDSLPEVRKVTEAAPGSAVLCRLVTSGEGSDWPLSRKYGCSTGQAVTILRSAAAMGLDAAGVSFHVGSQQRDPEAWRSPIAAAATVFEALRNDGLNPWLLDLGGGFPARHEGDVPPLAAYGAVIEDQLVRSFGHARPRTLVEPGRAVVGDAGALVSTVVGVVQRGDTRWVYLDAGVFTGLVETLDEAIRYRIETSADGGPSGPCVLAGPTCDSADVLYQVTPVQLPLALAEGDVVRLESAGAYTSCYSTVGFNGFDPLPVVVA